MTWLYGAVGLALGVTIGWAMCAFVSRSIEAENRELRGGLRYIRSTLAERGIAFQSHWIDRLLGDEAA